MVKYYLFNLNKEYLIIYYENYYYENILAHQNYVAKPNKIWAADFTSFELVNRRKSYVFICIDIFSNKIVVSLFITKQFTSYDFIQKLNQAIETRLPIKPRRELILYTIGVANSSARLIISLLSNKKIIVPRKSQ